MNTLSQRHAVSKLPPVFLNHFYVVVDSETYRDIEQSPFLRGEFAATEQRTTVRTDRSYTGLYFYGANTYFEFFDASGDSSRQVGFSGIAFGVDQAGELYAISKELSSGFAMDQELITRQYDGKQISWFYAGKLKDFPLDSGFAVWFMEYHPRFLNEWNPEPDALDQGVTRKEILRRYVAVLKDVPAEPYFEDVIAFTVAIDEAGFQKLSEFCKQIGYSERAAGEAKVFNGPDIELRLVQQTETARGIQQMTMRVKREPQDRNEFRFGTKSVLRFHGDGLATWSF